MLVYNVEMSTFVFVRKRGTCHYDTTNKSRYCHAYMHAHVDTGEACLGGVMNDYLVICLNNQNIANSYGKGEKIPPPPFNDRCTNLIGICGVVCADISPGPYPPYCTNGVIDTSILVSNATSVEENAQSDNWG